MSSAAPFQIDVSGFDARAGAFFTLAATAAEKWYDDAGNWIAKSMPAATRERYWLCFALYAAGRGALADAVIRAGKTDNSHEYGAPTHFNIFHSNIAAVLLTSHRDRMASDVATRLGELVREGLLFHHGNRHADYQFYGYNDNFPAKTTLGLILGGEMLGDDTAVRHGLWNLRQFRLQLSRRGINSEFNSPTYSPLTIHAMGEIAAHARLDEAREIARRIEERLWIDVAARFHPEIGVVSGPCARAYLPDLLGQLSSLSALLWFVLGDAARPSPLELFQPDPRMVFHHEGDIPFNIAQMCWFAAGAYHLPEIARALFGRKNYPFHAVATMEQGDWTVDLPARSGRIESYLQDDFTIGTVTTPAGEQAASYFVTYKRRETVASWRDVGTVFSRFLCNEQAPGEIIRHRRPDGGFYANSGEGYVSTHETGVNFQSESTALHLSVPRLGLGGSADYPAEPAPLSLLREMVVFPSHFGGADEIHVGGKVRAEWSGEVAHGEWVACRRGRLLIAIRPLVHSIVSPVRIRLEKINHYETLSMIFYQGNARIFSRPELRGLHGGFVAEHASVAEYESLAAFVRDLEQGRFTDYCWLTRRVCYRRPAGAGRPALEMEVSWSPGSHDTRFATANGRLISSPAAQYDGVETGRLPFLCDPFTPALDDFPWRDMITTPFQRRLGAIGDIASIGDRG